MPSRAQISRRNLLIVPAAIAVGSLTPAQTAQGAVMGKNETIQTPEKPPALKPELVQQFVRVAHGDLEMAIGGAGHMGRRDIALFLIEQGARMDVFVAAMLGEIEMVQSTLKAFPHLLQSKGPHGIPLIAHAKAGGKEAKAVLDYLQTLSEVR